MKLSKPALRTISSIAQAVPMYLYFLNQPLKCILLFTIFYKVLIGDKLSRLDMTNCQHYSPAP
jgi:hypothetical protein